MNESIEQEIFVAFGKETTERFSQFSKANFSMNKSSPRNSSHKRFLQHAKALKQIFLTLLGKEKLTIASLKNASFLIIFNSQIQPFSDKYNKKKLVYKFSELEKELKCS